jgi:hypothetical protein
MNFILFQLVVLHAALTSGFGRRHGFGGGFGGAGYPSSDLFPTCAVSYFQTLTRNFLLIISRTPAFRNSTHRTKSGKPAISKTHNVYVKTSRLRTESIAVYRTHAAPMIKRKHRNSFKDSASLLGLRMQVSVKARLLRR